MKNELCWQSQASCQAVPIKTCQKREWTQGGEKARSENGRSWERGPVFSTEPLRRAVGSRGVRSLLMVPDFPECLADSTPSFSFWWWVSLMIKYVFYLPFCRISWAKNVKLNYWNKMSNGFGSDYLRQLRGQFIHICYDKCSLSSNCSGRNETACFHVLAFWFWHSKQA